MPASALRPRTVSEIVDAAFQIFRAHAGSFVLCSTIAYIPALIIRLLYVGDLTRMAADPARMGQVLRLSGYSYLVSIASYAVMTALLTVCASQAYLGEEIDVGVALRRFGSRLLPFLVATVIVSVLTLLGFICLLVPAMYVTARYFAVAPAVLLEDRGAMAAMTRSGELSRGRKWHILNTIGLVLLIYFIVLIGLSLVGALVGGFTTQAILGALTTICFYPVIAITGVLLYYDARIQSEGLDIEMMADALGPAATPMAG